MNEAGTYNGIYWGLAGRMRGLYLTRMKNLFPFLFLLLPSILPAQEKRLLKILNDELYRQVRYQFKSVRFADDTIQVLQPFSISADKVLSVKIRQYQPDRDGYIEWLQEVPLEKVLSIDKDINVILRAGDEDVHSAGVRYARGGDPGKFEEKTNLFFLYFFTPNNNESLGKKIRRAFIGAGYKVDVEYWAD